MCYMDQKKVMYLTLFVKSVKFSIVVQLNYEKLAEFH